VYANVFGSDEEEENDREQRLQAQLNVDKERREERQRY
jgi:hypothetical protein